MRTRSSSDNVSPHDQSALLAAWLLVGLGLAFAGSACFDEAAPNEPDGGPAQHEPDTAPPGQEPDASLGSDESAPPPEGDASFAPERLSESGLYEDIGADILAPGVRPFEPQFELWTDGATKRRWVLLPEGAQIDDSDEDFWVYPEGTRLWKEFSLDGVRLETRLLVKTGRDPGDWHMMAYVWTEDQRDALAAPHGEPGVRGTSHDVPSQDDCMQCHDQMPDRALGFSALQLDHLDEASGVTLQTLLEEGRLRYGPPSESPPHYPLPGDEAEQEVLGYLHANCGGCHNSESDVLAGAARRPEFWLSVDEEARASAEATSTYRSTVDVRSIRPRLAPYQIRPGDPEQSTVYQRMTSRSRRDAMPPLGTNFVDEDAAAAVRAWIESLE